MRDAPCSVHMAKDEMAAKFFPGGQRLFQVYSGASFERSERSLSDRFAGKIGEKMTAIAMNHREAATVDRDAGGDGEMWGERWSVHRKFAAAGIYFEAGYGAEMFDDAGKHGGYRSKIADFLRKGEIE